MLFPLQYTGGKTKYVDVISKFFPKNLESMVSPFIGGGSIELTMAWRGVKVQGYDLNEELTSFWARLLENPEPIMDKAIQIWGEIPVVYRRYGKVHLNPIAREEFEWMKCHLDNPTLFYMVNRMSYGGQMVNWVYKLPSHEIERAEKLKTFSAPNLTVGWGDFVDTILKHPNEFIYADPPYYGLERTYGKGFSHVTLAEVLRNHKGGFVLSYNNCPEVQSLYSDFDMYSIIVTRTVAKHYMNLPRVELVICG